MKEFQNEINTPQMLHQTWPLPRINGITSYFGEKYNSYSCIVHFSMVTDINLWEKNAVNAYSVIFDLNQVHYIPYHSLVQALWQNVTDCLFTYNNMRLTHFVSGTHFFGCFSISSIMLIYTTWYYNVFQFLKGIFHKCFFN